MRTSLFSFVVAIFASWSACAPQADAALIIRDLNAPGDGLLTFDTSTGLEWLDMSATRGQSPLGGLAAFPDFRMASLSEVESLLIGAGIPAVNIGDGVIYFADLAAGELLSDTIGVTAVGGTLERIQGRVLRPSGDRYDLMTIDIRTPPSLAPGTSTNFLEMGNVLTSWQSNHANFMVRTAAMIPEPGSLALFGAALAGLALARRSRSRPAI